MILDLMIVTLFIPWIATLGWTTLLVFPLIIVLVSSLSWRSWLWSLSLIAYVLISNGTEYIFVCYGTIGISPSETSKTFGIITKSITFFYDNSWRTVHYSEGYIPPQVTPLLLKTNILFLLMLDSDTIYLLSHEGNLLLKINVILDSGLVSPSKTP